MGRSRIKKVEVRADGSGLSSRAGTMLLALAAERLGLIDALGWALAATRERRSAHDPGRVFCDVAVMLADGGRCVSDLVALGAQPALFGDVASVSTARRVLLSVGEAEIDRLRAARAQARARAWTAGAAPAEVIVDFDATAITAHSDKELAAGHYKGGFGFHPLIASCGREVLAAILRPGNAGANNAEDHLEVFEAALEQLPPTALEGPILARSDSAGASHALADACRETAVRFSFGYAIDARVREAILALAEAAWRPAINGDGEPRDGAWVAELTAQVGLDAWPQGSRLIVRRERPHPGAQLSFTDVDGHRFQCFITDQEGDDLAALEARHRAHAVVEDRVRELKSMGLANLPFSGFEPNQAWLEAALCAHDLTVWTQLLLFDGEHAVCEPKRLRYRLLHVAGKLTRHARRLTLHLPADWPWAAAIATAFKRLAALPA
ncbi:MAG TPA: IS1380 family transposase [Solirubrobacteraceae bacterium]|nr:IS1380 family transposase [Solirubrobacteraceae bacterium]